MDGERGGDGADDARAALESNDGARSTAKASARQRFAIVVVVVGRHTSTESPTTRRDRSRRTKANRRFRRHNARAHNSRRLRAERRRRRWRQRRWRRQRQRAGDRAPNTSRALDRRRLCERRRRRQYSRNLLLAGRLHLRARPYCALHCDNRNRLAQIAQNYNRQILLSSRRKIFAAANRRFAFALFFCFVFFSASCRSFSQTKITALIRSHLFILFLCAAAVAAAVVAAAPPSFRRSSPTNNQLSRVSRSRIFRFYR